MTESPVSADTHPYVAKDGTRFTPDQARVMTVLLRYDPRPSDHLNRTERDER